MPQHKSAAKRVVTNEKSRRRNAAIKSDLKKRIKKVRSDEAKEGGEARLREAHSALDKAVKKGVVHHRTAARRKSRLAKEVNKRG